MYIKLHFFYNSFFVFTIWLMILTFSWFWKLFYYYQSDNKYFNFLPNFVMFDSIVSELIAGVIIAAGSSFFTTMFNKKLRLKQQVRLSNNLNRPIAFIKNWADLKNDEIKLIQDSWLFKDVAVFDSTKSFVFDKDYGLIIYVFNQGNNEYADKIVETARSKNIPIILYANGLFLDDIKKQEVTSIISYPKYHMSQYTLNLLSAIFTTLSTYNHGTRK